MVNDHTVNNEECNQLQLDEGHWQWREGVQWPVSRVPNDQICRLVPSCGTIKCSYLNQGICNLIVHLLCGVVSEVGPIKGELFGRLVHGTRFFYEALAALHIHGQHNPGAQVLLSLIQGPASDHYLHRLWPHFLPFTPQTTVWEQATGRVKIMQMSGYV